ncbi:MAG: carboxypeptidase regulatory-like domain-containing protein [Burkholderiales bacterium]|nr:carboxypeptidase regulatory-like domain-containing protein [Burkholderiales bacterium]
MKKWNLVFDLALCTGCHNCVLAVKDEYVGNDFPDYSAAMPRHGHKWVDIRARERGRYPAVDIAYLFHACQHCDDAPCVAAARDGAVTKRDDGIVIIHPQRARDQRQILDACPYGAVHWNDELGLPQHWNFDAHLLDAGWREPRPVQACPTGALRVLKVEDDEMQRIARDEGLEPLLSSVPHRTRVHYRNLARHAAVFVAGTIVGSDGTLEACVAHARIRLTRGAETITSAVSDAYGDFRLDGLQPAAGSYRIEVSADHYQERALDFELDASCWLGEIRLDPRTSSSSSAR